MSERARIRRDSFPGRRRQRRLPVTWSLRALARIFTGKVFISTPEETGPAQKMARGPNSPTRSAAGRGRLAPPGRLKRVLDKAHLHPIVFISVIFFRIPFASPTCAAAASSCVFTCENDLEFAYAVPENLRKLRLTQPFRSQSWSLDAVSEQGQLHRGQSQCKLQASPRDHLSETVTQACTRGCFQRRASNCPITHRYPQDSRVYTTHRQDSLT